LGGDDDLLLERLVSNLAPREMTMRDYFGDTLDIEYYYRHPRNYSRRGIFSIDEPAPTMRGVNRPIPSGYPGHPNDACPVEECKRALTSLERALVQTFPAHFRWIGNKTEMEQMIGNAVPVKLAEYVADALGAYISSTENVTFALPTDVVDYTDFYTWLTTSHSFTERANKDVVSRLKRALSICEADGFPGAFYRFKLEQSPNYQALSPSVRSQVKKSVSLYSDYYNEKHGELKLPL
jgi:DNA (cytosine-5)-methyltransferase 1